MNNLKEWAMFYISNGINIIPYNNFGTTSDSFYGKFISLEQIDIINWNEVFGLKAVLGSNEVRAILLYIEGLTADKSQEILNESLSILQLPKNYPWIIHTYSPESYAIIVESEVNYDMGNRVFYNGVLLWQTDFVLPSSVPQIRFLQNVRPSVKLAHVNIDLLLGCMNQNNMKGLLDKLKIEYKKIIPPINSDVFVIERKDGKFGAMKLNQMEPIVEFGKYAYMWGYDGKYCLVNMGGRSYVNHEDRGIINCSGIEVIKPYTYDSIWSFYGEKWPNIRVENKGWIIELDKKDVTSEKRRIKLSNRR